jgi:MFS family permease
MAHSGSHSDVQPPLPPSAPIPATPSAETVCDVGGRPVATTSPEIARLDEKKDKSRTDVVEKDEERAGSATPPVDIRDQPYPEGGLQAWLVVFGAWCGLTACFGLGNSIGAFQQYFLEGSLSDYSDGAVGWIFGVFIFTSFFGGLVCGPVLDMYGPRWLLLAGSIMMVASVILLSWCTEYYQIFLCFGILAGVGCSLVFTPGFTVPGHYFLKRRGFATGIAATGGSVGGVIFPLVLDNLSPKIGYPWAVRVVGFLMLFLFIISNLLVRSRLPPLPGSSSKPDLRIFRQGAFACVTLAAFFMEIAMFVPVNYITTYATYKGMDAKLAFQLISILNAGSFFGRWIAGFVADRIGRYNALTIFCVVCFVSMVGLWLPAGDSPGMMIAFALMFGFGSGSNISLTPVCMGQLCKTEEYGRYYATAYTIVSFGVLVGLPAAGNIINAQHGEYSGMILYTAAAYVIAIVATYSSKGLAVGWKPSVVF